MLLPMKNVLKMADLKPAVWIYHSYSRDSRGRWKEIEMLVVWHPQPALQAFGNGAAVLAGIPLVPMESLQIYCHVSESKIELPQPSLPAASAWIQTEMDIRDPGICWYIRAAKVIVPEKAQSECVSLMWCQLLGLKWLLAWFKSPWLLSSACPGLWGQHTGGFQITGNDAQHLCSDFGLLEPGVANPESDPTLCCSLSPSAIKPCDLKSFFQVVTPGWLCAVLQTTPQAVLVHLLKQRCPKGWEWP